VRPETETRVKQQLSDGVQSLPPHQALMLLWLVREIQAHPEQTQWAWALGIDEVGGNHVHNATQ